MFPGLGWGGAGGSPVASLPPTPRPVGLGRFTVLPPALGPHPPPRKAADILLPLLFYKVNRSFVPAGLTPIWASYPQFRVRPTFGRVGGTLCPAHPCGLGATLVLCQGCLPALLLRQLSPDSRALPFLSVPSTRGGGTCMHWSGQPPRHRGSSPFCHALRASKSPRLGRGLRPAILRGAPPPQPNQT